MTTEGNGNEKEIVTVVIDGRAIQAEKGAALLQVALDNGVEIPHYCYHPKLSIDGSCRMCQVKIEKAPKLAISCNTPVTDGMVVDTKADEVAKAHRGVMELLLVNHPLDCPICDQAGECYLQDYSYDYGRHDARTTSPRRKGVKRYPIGPRVVFDEERCILCRRCVRFTTEITETDELRVFGLGDHSHIATVPGAPLDNDYSINTADICPVGALLSKDFHHKRRVWFLEETQSICPGCSKGCNTKLGMFRNEIQRIVPRRNDDVNDTWMCDGGRLNYHFAQGESRVRSAMHRPAEPAQDSQTNIGTADAIRIAAESIRRVVDEHGVQAIGIITGGHLTNEEFYRLAELAQSAIGTANLDTVIPTGPSDDFLMQPDKAANGYGARDMGIAPGRGGKGCEEILAAAAAGDIKVLLVIGSGDLVSVVEEEKLSEALAGLELLVVQDASASGLTQRADLVLPAQVWAEKDGSFTNHMGRVQRIRRAMKPPPDSLADGEIFQRLSSLIAGDAGEPKVFDARATLAAIADSHPGYAEISFETIGSLGRERVAGASGTEGDSAPAGA